MTCWLADLYVTLGFSNHRNIVLRHSDPCFPPFIKALRVEWLNTTSYLPSFQSKANRKDKIQSMTRISVKTLCSPHKFWDWMYNFEICTFSFRICTYFVWRKQIKHSFQTNRFSDSVSYIYVHNMREYAVIIYVYIFFYNWQILQTYVLYSVSKKNIIVYIHMKYDP